MLDYYVDQPDKKFNADESGISLCTTSGRVLAIKSSKNVL